MSNYNIQKEFILHLVLRRCCGAKRRKKSHATPKKNKHKRKKAKLAVLKYYKVEENGRINHLHWECPSPKSYIVEINIDGNIEKGVMRETQFHPVKDYCQHIDFFRVVAGKPVAIEIPVAIVGNSEGVKAGGKLQVLRRKLAVSGLEENLLDELVIDITPLGVGKTINIGDLKYEGLTMLQPASTSVVAVVATRQSGK